MCNTSPSCECGDRFNVVERVDVVFGHVRPYPLAVEKVVIYLKQVLGMCRR